MNKEDLGKVLSLSCVENYFLGYLQKRIDIRLLYVESFVSFNEVINAFLGEHVSYENYPLTRLQETSEKLGLTSHRLNKRFRYQKGELNLIRVNRKLFSNSRITPWRADHYIAIEKAEDEYKYINNYPLSEGIMSQKRLSEIYDGASLIFQEVGKFNERKYKELSVQQYTMISNQSVDAVSITEEKLIHLRDAIMILKVLRKRVTAWLQLEAERKSFSEDLSFLLLAEKLNKGYENLQTALQLQITRRRTDINLLNEKFLSLCDSERLWNKEIQKRRG